MFAARLRLFYHVLIPQFTKQHVMYSLVQCKHNYDNSEYNITLWCHHNAMQIRAITTRGKATWNNFDFSLSPLALIHFRRSLPGVQMPCKALTIFDQTTGRVSYTDMPTVKHWHWVKMHTLNSLLAFQSCMYNVPSIVPSPTPSFPSLLSTVTVLNSDGKLGMGLGTRL